MTTPTDPAALVARSKGYADLMHDLEGSRMNLKLAQLYANHITNLASALEASLAREERYVSALRQIAATETLERAGGEIDVPALDNNQMNHLALAALQEPRT